MAEAVERRLRGSSLSLRFPDPVTLEEVRQLFPTADRIIADQPRGGWHQALAADNTTLGYAVRTSPFSDNGRGYQGPTETLVAVTADRQTVTGWRLRKSYDTEEYVVRVAEDEDFQRRLAGRTVEEWAKIDFQQAGIEGVSGATQTSFAVADGVRKRFAADEVARAAEDSNWKFQPGLLAIIAGGLLMTFTPLRGNRRARWIWQGVLIVAFAVWLGDLLSLSLLVGWSRHGIPWQSAPVVVLLVAVALLVPWGTRRQIYCQQLCPHGAAQSWLGQFTTWHLRLAPEWSRWLGRLPAALLAGGLGLGVFILRFDLAQLEPFDGWVLKGGAAVSAGLAIVGLIASVFVPQAYCRFGCPTGELLQLVKSGGSHDRIQRRDWLTAGWVALLAVLVIGGRSWGTSQTVAFVDAPPLADDFQQLQGKAFGTTWSIKFRGPHDPAKLQPMIAAELERIESTLSHWRPDSSTSQFNASETTLAPEQPAELLALVSRALKISRQTDGAYDITVAPLVDAWGFGPSGRKSPPSDEELDSLLQRTGFEKLEVDETENTLRKKHPQLQLDLGSLLQGYAADCCLQKLKDAGVTESLIDIGGELLAQGSWLVAIENPSNPNTPLRTLRLENQSLATGGIYRAKKLLSGESTHHLISPRTGRPYASTATLCAVIAPTAIEADAWATALLAVGLPQALDLAEQQRLMVLLLAADQKTHVNKAGAELLGQE
jgi:thiamine biosynthesis lipoprotein ApbE